MFEQLTKIVRQFSEESIVQNSAIPNEHNEGVIQETSGSIMASLQKMVSEGGIDQLAGLFHDNNAQDPSNPAVKQITEQLNGSLGSKFGLDQATSASVAGGMIPKILGSLVGKAKDPSDSSFEISDIVNAISGSGGQSGGLMSAISKYGSQLGLDQNKDGKVDLSDASGLTKEGGISDLLGKVFDA